MRSYECMLILDNRLDDDARLKSVNNIKEIIAKNGGNIISEENIGKKRLAYEIKKNKDGYYYLLVFKIASEAVKKIERAFSISDDILKDIIVLQEEVVVEKPRKK